MSAPGAVRGRVAVSLEVAERFPDYAALVVYAAGLRNPPGDPRAAEALDAAARAALDRSEMDTQNAHLASWRTAFSSFGAKPSRYPCSAEALLKRVRKGQGLPAVNALVDAYNAVSLEFGVPIGGEDLDALAGQGVLRVAGGDEPFVEVAADEERIVHPEPGEIVWADDLGVTCRRWSWRQCRRTQLTTESRNAYFLLERLAPYPLELLEAAGRRLRELVSALAAPERIASERLGPGWS